VRACTKAQALQKKKRVSSLRVKMRSWDPHTGLFRNIKACACPITDLFDMQESLFSIYGDVLEWEVAYHDQSYR